MARDTYLVAGCAAAGAAFLAAGVLAADVAHAMTDPRIGSARGADARNRGRGARGVRAAGRSSAVVAPSLAPYDARRSFHRLSVRAADAAACRRRGRPLASAAFAYPIHVVDRIERRYAEDRTRLRDLHRRGGARGSCSAATRSDATCCRACSPARGCRSASRSSPRCLALVIGAALGAAAGYAGGWVDARPDARRGLRHRPAGDLRGARVAGRAAAGADARRRCSWRWSRC